ncbi:Beta-hexosaminidase [Indibacter alkaliphilus LW1]|uniref:beta-N-acetylhexosaminidase n=1 Tax=Indibacter alkaliphilus (strain CCUG 57479 / KCTC 22604 / LW1) TaxID=1189612 RepID=S2E1G1_INDAL|nr:beta-N-acetylhexosaminidase [Indibacter alkaliphilus]EOZ98301.1 Beta-hexosaminidase [Indibacter alkaliphilus LW1]
MNFKRLISKTLGVSLAAVLLSCSSNDTAPLSMSPIIPLPVSIVDADGAFKIGSTTKIAYSGNALNEVQKFSESIKSLTGLGLEIEEGATSDAIIFAIEANASSNAEGYKIDINTERVLISAPTEAGLYWGAQTFLQVIPADGTDSGLNPKFAVSAGTIEDYPEYEYRGMMLDVARHFFPVSEVKHLIDNISTYKINHLHLHLSDDQGWRIEIKSWPLLTEIGGSTQVGGGAGGFYTQEDYKEIVRYAAERHMVIVPEIDMPGHTNSALAAYGELNPGIKVPDDGAVPTERTQMGVAGQPTPLYTGRDVGFSTLDTDKPVTYKFIEDVIREISEITPGPYFHIGGDESHVTAMEDYVPFIEKAQAIVAKYGKKSLGWDEVAHAELLPNTVVQYWAKAENAIMGIEQGAKVLISPAVRTYLDMKYDSTTHIGLNWAAYIELDEAYNWDPTTLEEEIKREHIVGVEAPLWTETVVTRDDIEFLTFPRLAAVAEVAWTPIEKRNWEDFSKRIKYHGVLWENSGVNFYRSPKIDW